MQFSYSKVLDHEYVESDVNFLIRVPIQFEILRSFINMATLKVKI